MWITSNKGYARVVVIDTIINHIRYYKSFALGKIIDLKNRIFKNKELGFFNFNEEKGEYKIFGESYTLPIEDNVSGETSQVNTELKSDVVTSTNETSITDKKSMLSDDLTNSAGKEESKQINTESTDQGNENKPNGNNSERVFITDNVKSCLSTYPNRGLSKHTIGFGAEFALHEIIVKSRIDEVIKKTLPNNDESDTFTVLMLSNLLGIDSALQVKNRYENSVLCLLYPNAKVTSQDISRFHEKFGSSIVETDLLLNHFDYIFNICGLSKDFNLDSAGVKCSSKAILEVDNWNHENDLGLGFRLGMLDHIKGMPIIPFVYSGNVHDVTTFSPVNRKLKVLGINPQIFRIDSAYIDDKNIDMCYDEKNNCICDYISRLKKRSTYYTPFIKNGLDFLKKEENIYIYNNRQLYIAKEKILAGTQKDKPAYIYLIYDKDLFDSEYKELKEKLIDGNITKHDFHEALKTIGVFCLISGKEYTCDQILHEYLKRIGIENTIKFSKNDLSVFPLRTYNQKTFYGKIYVGFYSLVVLRIVQFLLKKFDLNKKSFFNILANQTAYVYANKILIQNRIPAVNDIYEKLGIILPDEITIENDGSLTYQHAEKDDIPEWAIIAMQGKPYISKQKKEPTKKTNKDNSKKVNKNVTNEQKTERIPPKSKPGRKPGSRNEKTVKREGLVCTLSEILKQKCKNQGISEEEFQTMQAEAAAQNAKSSGRNTGSKNKRTLRKEALEEQARLYIDMLSNEFSLPKIAIINLILFNSTEAPTTPKSKQRGRPKGSFTEKTLEKKAIDKLIESSVALCQQEAADLNLTEEQLLSLATGITLKLTLTKDSSVDQSRKAPGGAKRSRLGVKHAATLKKEADMEKAYNWVSELAKKQGMTREEAIQRLWTRNRKMIVPDLPDPDVKTRGRNKGSYGRKRIEAEVIKFIIQSGLIGAADSDSCADKVASC